MPVAAVAEEAKSERVSEFTLANGLQVVVIPDHRAPVATQMVWYKAGAVDEPPGTSGIAHFLEHLMFKGTDTIGRLPQGNAPEGFTDMGGHVWEWTGTSWGGRRDHAVAKGNGWDGRTGDGRPRADGAV